MGPGQPLDRAARAFMEPGFRQDFSGVRVHADDAAAEAARSISARAFTGGHHLAFAAGEYAPGTTAGNELLAPELTHVVQQTGALSTRSDKHIPNIQARHPERHPTISPDTMAPGEHLAPAPARRANHSTKVARA
jgi:hypothetical protein